MEPEYSQQSATRQLLRQMNPIHMLTSYFLVISFNINLPYAIYLCIYLFKVYSTTLFQ
jgi:hypothetical protein